MNRYRAYQLLIDSELPLLGFAPTLETGPADVSIRLGELPPAPETGLPWSVSDSEVSLWVEGIAAFRSCAGREMIVAPEPDIPLSRVALALRSSMWAALMMQRGLVPLHATCLDSPNGAVLLLGQVGVGKSTLATALQYQGFQMVCDEMAVLRFAGGSVEVVPSFPEVRLGPGVGSVRHSPRGLGNTDSSPVAEV